MFLFAAMATGQDVEAVSLPQAIHLALKNNPQIEIARFEPWMEHHGSLSTLGAFDYSIYASGQTSYTRFPGTTFFAGAPVVEQKVYDVSAGLRRRFENGIQAELGIRAQGTETNSAFALINPAWQDTLGLTLTIPLLRDAGAASTTAVILIQKQRHFSAVDSFESSVTTALHAVIRAYHELVFADRRRDLATRSLDLSRQLVQDNQRKVDNGLVPRIQLTEAQAQVAVKQQELIRARQGYLNASDQLRRLIDPSSLRTSDRALAPAEVASPPFEPLDEKALAEKALSAAFEARPDLRQARRAVETAEVRLAKSRVDALPRLDVVAHAAMLGIDNTAQDAFTKMFRFDSGEFMGGVSFEMPVEHRAAYHTLKRAELEARQSRASVRELESRVVLEVREAAREIKAQELTLNAVDEQVRLAEERYAAEKSRMDQGLTTTYFLLASQNDLDTARLNQIRARIDLAVSRQTLLRANGTLLREYGISVAEELSPIPQ